jgi:hypothetical protein
LLVFFLCSGSAIKRRDVSPLNGAPHAITVACYSADPYPSPIKTQIKATSRGGLQERKTGDCRKEKQRTAGAEKEGKEKTRRQRRREKIERNENKKNREITGEKTMGGKNTGNKERHSDENQPHICLHPFISKPKVTEHKHERVW